MGQLPWGRLRTSPLGVKQNTSSVKRSTFTVSRNSRGSLRSCCHSMSCRSQANFCSSLALRPSLYAQCAAIPSSATWCISSVRIWMSMRSPVGPIPLRLRDLLLDVGKVPRLQVAEGEVLELDLDPLDAEPVGERRVDVESLLRDAVLRLGLHVLEGPHVVGPVGELDEDDANVLRHRDQHLAEVLGLLLLLG